MDYEEEFRYKPLPFTPDETPGTEDTKDSSDDNDSISYSTDDPGNVYDDDVCDTDSSADNARKAWRSNYRKKEDHVKAVQLGLRHSEDFEQNRNNTDQPSDSTSSSLTASDIKHDNKSRSASSTWSSSSSCSSSPASSSSSTNLEYHIGRKTSSTHQFNNSSNVLNISAKAMELPDGKFEILDFDLISNRTTASARSSTSYTSSASSTREATKRRNKRRMGGSMPLPPPPRGTLPDECRPRRWSSRSVITPEVEPDDEHAAVLSQFICELYRNDQLTDIVVRLKEAEFSAHRVVLACHSRHFAALLVSNESKQRPRRGQKSDQHEVIEVNFNFTPECFAGILNYMYTGHVANDSETELVEQLFAAIELDMVNLRRLCNQHVDRYKAPQALRFLSAADDRGLDHSTLFRRQWRLVAAEFWSVVTSEEFLMLNPRLVRKLLSREDLRVRSERDVVIAAIKWIKANESARKRYASRLLGAVHFKNLTADELVALAQRHDYMFTDPVIKNAILEANWYHTCRVRKSTVAE